MKLLKSVVIMGIVGACVAAIGGLAFIYSGVYPMGADVPHTKAVYWALDTMRERSIATRTKDIQVPNLDDPKMLLAGGQDYNEMCAGCHLKPGKTTSDLNAGLYPQPPNLALPHRMDLDAKQRAARQFWYIKHGIKASGMPAWGSSHTDERIWEMVAFLQKMPTMSPEVYQIVTAPPEGESGMAGMSHDGM
ncbi:c-type cytochrome [Aquirhabdus sp.]|uniref:c-type cytochrome n=1 Tax=Aquirhabdus sp. TaxID=2824160 RepID=UPI00396CFA95